MKTTLIGRAALAALVCGGVSLRLPAQIPPIAVEPKVAFTQRHIDVAEGTGAPVERGKCVYAHYTGWLADGTRFGSSRDTMTDGRPGTPFTFAQGERGAIPGFDNGFAGMRVGSRRRLFIPHQLAYGTRGQGQRIPPNTDLVFDVEVMAVADTLPRARITDIPPGLRPTAPRCARWDELKSN